MSEPRFHGDMPACLSPLLCKALGTVWYISPVHFCVTMMSRGYPIYTLLALSLHIAHLQVPLPVIKGIR